MLIGRYISTRVSNYTFSCLGIILRAMRATSSRGFDAGDESKPKRVKTEEVWDQKASISIARCQVCVSASCFASRQLCTAGRGMLFACCVRSLWYRELSFFAIECGTFRVTTCCGANATIPCSLVVVYV